MNFVLNKSLPAGFSPALSSYVEPHFLNTERHPKVLNVFPIRRYLSLYFSFYAHYKAVNNI